MRQGQIWQFERDRPSKEDDPRTPYRVAVTLDALTVALRTEMDLSLWAL